MKYDVFGEHLWIGDVPKFEDLMDFRRYEEYCISVWRAFDCRDTRTALKLWQPESGFWTYGWQRIWIDRQLKLMMGYIEDHAKGQQVSIEIRNYIGDKMKLRKHL